MICPACGSQNALGAAFCSACGTALTSAQGPTAGAPGYYGGPSYYHGVPIGPRVSGMAVAGLVLSFFCSMLGLIFSIIAHNEIKHSNGTLTGSGMAVAGIIISSIHLVLFIIAVSVN